eukprot:4513960-Pyramimonas_sp.AAC.1
MYSSWSSATVPSALRCWRTSQKVTSSSSPFVLPKTLSIWPISRPTCCLRPAGHQRAWTPRALTLTPWCHRRQTPRA